VSDEYDPDAEANAYSDDEKAYGADPDYNAPIPVQPVLADPPRAAPRRALSGLGDFSPEGRCVVTALAKLLWRFFTQVAAGSTQDALVTLSVYRSLYGLKRADLVAGFAPGTALPATIPDTSWSQPMMASAVLVLFGAYGGTDAPVMAVLRTMPSNMAALATWFPNLQNATTPEEALALRAYSDAPMPTAGDPARILAAYVVDDLHACNPAAVATPAPTPAATTPAPASSPFVYRPGLVLPSTPIHLAPPPAAAPPPVTSSGGALPQREGGMGLWGIALLALAGYGAWLAYQDHQKVMSERKHGVAGLDDE